MERLASMTNMLFYPVTLKSVNYLVFETQEMKC